MASLAEIRAKLNKEYTQRENIVAKRAKRASQTTETLKPRIPTLRKAIKEDVVIKPRNINQNEFIKQVDNLDNHIIFGVGPAGCGKTLLSTMLAIKALKEEKIEKIVITRPNVAVDDNDIGYLPGDILEKLTPWMMPILDVFAEYYTQREIKQLLTEKIVEMVPLAYIRGRTFKNCYILFDEAQNSTETSMLSVLTRIGEGSKLIVTGDVRQGDKGIRNGLSGALRRIAANEPSHIVVTNFKDRDVERHPVIPHVLNIYRDLELI